LLGTVDIRLDDHPARGLGSARAESLLAYLLLHRDAPQPREQLAFRLWPESGESQARTNLRHVLHDLRRALPNADRFLDVQTRTVQWRTDAPYWLDVAAFESSVARSADSASSAASSGHDATETLASLREAVELYRGDLVESCYDEWIAAPRDRLRHGFLGALERLATLLAEHGNHIEAIARAERLVLEEPLREDAYRLLMRLHDARGDRASALLTYRTCVATLAREVGAPPSAPTREAYEALLRGEGANARRVTSNPSPNSRSPTHPPLVGRTDEWTLLTKLWRTVERGGRAFLLVTGEAGVGKTRLVEELRGWCEQRGAAALDARSYAAEGELAYAPVTAWLRAPAVNRVIARLDRPRLSELTRLLPELSSRLAGIPRPQRLPEDEQRHRLFDTAAEVLSSLGSPVVLVLDDIQWCDHETLRFIHFLLRHRTAAPLLVAATARLEEMDRNAALTELITGLTTWGSITKVELQRLTRGATADLGSRLGERPLAAHDAEALFAETEGNPLFVVEAMRAGWQLGRRSADAMTPKVQAVIASRLDQLSAETRELTGLAATLGRDFTIELLAHARDTTTDAVARNLDELWRARILREHEAGVYDFSHDKIREVAYAALSPPQRRQYHLRAAHALKRIHARDTAAASGASGASGAIAAHYDRAGVAEEAITWYETAAEAAQYLYATREATRLLDRALELLATLPASPERQARELAILTAMLTPVVSADGFTSPRLDGLHTRIIDAARTLLVELPPQALRSIAVSSLTRDDFDTARRYGEMLRARGGADGDDALLVEGEYVLGIAAFWNGRLVAAREHFETAVARYRPDRRRTHLLRYWLDPQVICLSRLGNTYWFLGDTDAARAARDKAIALGAEIGHAHSHRTAYVFAALLAVDMGDTAALRGYVRALEAGADDRDARATLFATETLRAYVRVIDGDAEGMTAIRDALASLGTGGHAPGQRAFTARLLVAAAAVSGDPRELLATADRMLAMGGAASLWEAEVLRVRAECLAQLGADPEEISETFERAVAIAKSQGARVLQERAEAMLARFCRPERTEGRHSRNA
jgi:DNA-binding SARP family transcriptional activator